MDKPNTPIQQGISTLLAVVGTTVIVYSTVRLLKKLDNFIFTKKEN